MIALNKEEVEMLIRLKKAMDSYVKYLTGKVKPETHARMERDQQTLGQLNDKVAKQMKGDYYVSDEGVVIKREQAITDKTS